MEKQLGSTKDEFDNKERIRTEKWVGPTYSKKHPSRFVVSVPADGEETVTADDIFKGPEWTEGEDGKFWFNPSTTSDSVVVEEVESPLKWWVRRAPRHDVYDTTGIQDDVYIHIAIGLCRFNRGSHKWAIL